jgi:hypothetical protein
VPDAALAGRARKLKCAQCGFQWQVGGAAPAAEPRQAPPPPVVPPLPPLSELAYLQRPRPGAAAAEAAPASEPAAPAYEPPPEPSYPPPVPARLPARVTRTPGNGQAERDSFATLVEAARQTTSEAEARRQQRLARRQTSPWLISILLLLLAILLIWVERVHVMHIWPPSIRLFDAIDRLFRRPG